MITFDQAAVEIAGALEPLADEIDGIQIVAQFNPNPTPPSIDVWFGGWEPAGFGTGRAQLFQTVRARVSTADYDSGYALLLGLVDVIGPRSVAALIEGADAGVIVQVSPFQQYEEDTQTNGRLLGVEWRIARFNA